MKLILSLVAAIIVFIGMFALMPTAPDTPPDKSITIVTISQRGIVDTFTVKGQYVYLHEGDVKYVNKKSSVITVASGIYKFTILEK